MTIGRTVRRAVRFVVHNWPLKLAAVVLATFLYAGFVASQDSSSFPGPITVETLNQPGDTVVTNQIPEVDQLRYLAPAGVPRPRPGDFRATVDLANVRPDGNPVNVPVRVTPVDPRITIIDISPRTVQIVLDTRVPKDVPVRVERGESPGGIDVGETEVEPLEVTITGASAAVARVVAGRVAVVFDPGGLDVDREIEVRPIDVNGEVVAGVDVEPRTVHVRIPLFTDRESRTVPVNAIVTGAPAPGFRISAVRVEPQTVLVQGDAEQLTALAQADTAPVSLFGATADVAQTVTLALPSGIVATGSGAVTVRVSVEAKTETRSFTAGFDLAGEDPALDYAFPPDRILLTLFGPVAALDQLGATPLVVTLNVAGLGPGEHEVPVDPVLPSGVSAAVIAPDIVRVTVTQDPGSSPAPPGASTAPSPIP